MTAPLGRLARSAARVVPVPGPLVLELVPGLGLLVLGLVLELVVLVLGLVLVLVVSPVPRSGRRLRLPPALPLPVVRSVFLLPRP